MALSGSLTGTADFADGDEEMRLVRNAKQIALFAIGVANQKYGTELQKQQEVPMSISDIIMESFAMESTPLRKSQASRLWKGPERRKYVRRLFT